MLTNQTASPSPSPSQTVLPSLRVQTMLGILWMVFQALGTKLVSILGQLVLAYLLVPEHFAAISLTYTVTALARVLENGGLREVLVHRATEFERWANPAFWLSLLLGCMSAVLIVVAAPFAATLYDSEEVKTLLLILAVSPVLYSLTTVPVARLQTNHRFRALAGLAALLGCSQIAATVFFAWFGWGARSFAFGTLFSAIVHAAVAWYISAPAIRRKLDVPRWRSLWNDTRPLVLAGLATTVTQQADYMLLGIYHSKLEVGLYFFAYSLATQATQILSSNLAAVFLPVLCRLNANRERHLRASIDACTVMAAFGIPLTFLQSVLTDPAFRLMLPAKWLPAVPYAEVLTLGLGLNLLTGLCWSMLKAQGRFQTIFTTTIVSAAAFTGAVFFAAKYGTPFSVACCVLLMGAAYSPVILWLSLTRLGGTWADVFQILTFPILASALAFGLAFGLDRLVVQDVWGDWFRLFASGVVFVAVYVGLLVLTRHPLLAETWRITAYFRERVSF